MVSSPGVLRWLYLGRCTLAGGIFAAALLVWTRPQIAPEMTLVATLVLVVTLAFTAGSFWHTHIARQSPGVGFLYAQALFDVLLVTAVVHLTGRGESEFAPLYVLVITEGALLLPLPGGFVIGAMAALLYFADATWGGTLTMALGASDSGAGLNAVVLTRMALFGVVALVTAWLGDRVRRTGTQLGAVESELRQLRLDTSDILGTLDTGVVTVDADGMLVYMNPAAEKLLGLRSRDWMGQGALDELGRVAPGISTVVRRTLSTGRPVQRYETHSRATPEVRVLGVRTTPLEREREQRPWVTMVLQDITDAQRLEALHRRTDRLEAVAEMAASLAHEIKNPLASIRSAVEQLTRRQGRRLADADRVTLEKLALAESDRLSRLLTGFIEFSRVELRERREVDLSAVAAEAVDVVRQHPEAVNGAAVELASGGPVWLEGDADLLHRVVFNLVLNAVQHSESGQEVRVAVSPVSEAELPAGTEFSTGARLTVSDRGPGIREEDLARVFDPFFTTRRGGSGLGLALVHRAVEAHNGLIFIEAEEGRGTTFTVLLPTRAGEGKS